MTELKFSGLKRDKGGSLDQCRINLKKTDYSIRWVEGYKAEFGERRKLIRVSSLTVYFGETAVADIEVRWEEREMINVAIDTAKSFIRNRLTGEPMITTARGWSVRAEHIKILEERELKAV